MQGNGEKTCPYAGRKIQEMDRLKKRRRSADRKDNAYVNVIYKMMRDGHTNDTIYHYLWHIGI